MSILDCVLVFFTCLFLLSLFDLHKKSYRLEIKPLDGSSSSSDLDPEFPFYPVTSIGEHFKDPKLAEGD